MLTCSVMAAAASVPGRNTLVMGGQKMMPLLLYPSTKSNLLSLKQCVHKLMTKQQSSLLSTSSSAFPQDKECYSKSLVLCQQLHKPSGSTGTVRSSRIRHYYSCSLLNLNHHISFHYINNSIRNTCHHRSFHQSAPAPAGGTGGVASDSSITPNNSQDIVNDSRKPELSFPQDDWDDEDDDGRGRRLHNDAAVATNQEEEEFQKEQIWSVGPTLLPTFNVGAYANESENVKKLVQLGVDLSQWEPRYGMIPLLYKSNFEKTMQPIITFLQEAGVDGDDLAKFLTVNPKIFHEDVSNLEKRLEYLRAKRFSEDAILHIITRNPYWLTFSVARIDRRLGFFQSYFGLTGDQVRKLATTGSSGPKLITFNLGRVKDVTFKFKEEMGFTSEEIVQILLTLPRLFKEFPGTVWEPFNYLHNEENFSHEELLRQPKYFRTRARRLRERIGFLKEIGRAQFDPEQPGYITADMVCTGIDSEFATQVCGVSVEQYNNYLKTL